MPIKAGVWIDHKQAIVVLLTDTGQEIRKFSSGMRSPVGKARSTNKYTPNDFVAEDRRERKIMAERKKVYEDLIAYLQGTDSLLILGPGEAKGEFQKYLSANRRRGLAPQVETADKMTDRQLVAKVTAHFTKSPAGKSVAPKTMAKPRSGKRTKRTKKQLR